MVNYTLTLVASGSEFQGLGGLLQRERSGHKLSRGESVTNQFDGTTAVLGRVHGAPFQADLAVLDDRQGDGDVVTSCAATPTTMTVPPFSTTAITWMTGAWLETQSKTTHDRRKPP